VASTGTVTVRVEVKLADGFRCLAAAQRALAKVAIVQAALLDQQAAELEATERER
jgi:hypothetical protein